MKKLLILLILVAGCAKQPVYKASRAPSLTLQDINIGTVANDGTGDPLRTAFGKINTNNIALRNLAASLYTQTETNNLLALKANLASPQFSGTPRISTDTVATNTSVRTVAATQIADSIAARIAAGADARDYLWSKADTIFGQAKQVVTQTQLSNYTGSGSGYSEYSKEFTVGDSGFPGNGDSTITSTDWRGRIVKVYRDGTYQRHRTTADGKEGIRINNTTGQITFHPALLTAENIIIEAADHAHRIEATVTGTESSLLTGLRAFYKLDETAGTNVTDQTGNYDGVTTATVGTVGRFGYAETFNGSTYVNAGASAGDVGTNDFTLAGRIYITAWPGTYDCAGMAGNWGDYPYFYIGVYGDHKVKAVVNFAGTNIEIFSNSAISLSTWYDIALVADRSGNLTLYLNGTAQTDVADISAHSAVNVVNNNTFAIGRVGNTLSGHWFTGVIDDVGLWTKATSGAELTTFTGGTYPW